MSSIRGRIGPWVWISLALPAVIAGGIEFGVVADILSPSVWIDVLALWPVAAIGIVAAPIAWFAAGRRMRHIAIAGLSVFTWLALGLALHISGSAVLPVGAASVEGPATSGITDSHLEIDIADGTLEISARSDVLYRIAPIRAGGDVGAPATFEQLRETAMTIVATPTVDPGRYVFRGWEVALAPAVSWRLDATARRVDADFGGLPQVAALLVAESGDETLGEVVAPSTLELTGGTHRITVDPGVPVAFRGQGVVPDDWSIADDGTASSPAAGDGWTIRATDGATVEIWYR